MPLAAPQRRTLCHSCVCGRLDEVAAVPRVIGVRIVTGAVAGVCGVVDSALRRQTEDVAVRGGRVVEVCAEGADSRVEVAESEGSPRGGVNHGLEVGLLDAVARVVVLQDVGVLTRVSSRG
jgi:hypothetical protein